MHSNLQIHKYTGRSINIHGSGRCSGGDGGGAVGGAVDYSDGVAAAVGDLDLIRDGI